MEGRRSKIGIFYISFSLSVHLDQHYIFGSGPYSDLVQTFILYRYLPYTLHCTVIRYRYLNTNNYVSRTSRSECKLNWTATFQENVMKKVITLIHHGCCFCSRINSSYRLGQHRERSCHFCSCLTSWCAVVMPAALLGA